MKLNEEDYKLLKSIIYRKDSFLHNVVDNMYQNNTYFIGVEFLRTENSHYRFFEIKKPAISFRGLIGFELIECKSNKEFIFQEYDTGGNLSYYIKNDDEFLCVFKLNCINHWLEHCI